MPRQSSDREWSEVSALVDVPSWEVAAYRMSLLTMLADLEDLHRKLGEGHLDPAVAVPIEAEFSQTGEMVETEIDGEIQMVTKGKVKRRREADE